MNNIDHLVTMPRSAGKPWVLAFMWTPLWEAPLTQTPLQTKYSRSWQKHSSMTVAPQQEDVTASLQKRLRNDPGNMSKSSKSQAGFWIPQISIQLNIHWMYHETRTIHGGPNMDGSWLWYIPQMLNCFGIWGIQRPAQRLEFFVRFIRPFLSRFCSVAGALSCRGALPSRSAAAMRGCTRSATMFGWMILVKEAPHKCQDSEVPSRTIDCNKMINAHFTCQCFNVLVDGVYKC